MAYLREQFMNAGQEPQKTCDFEKFLEVLARFEKTRADAEQ